MFSSLCNIYFYSDTATRLSKEVCFWLSQASFENNLSASAMHRHSGMLRSGPSSAVCLPHVLLQLMQSCNRSVPNEEIMLVAVSCLLNIARQPELADRMDIWWLPPDSDACSDRRRQRTNSVSSSTSVGFRLSLDPRGGSGSPPNSEHQRKNEVELAQGLCLVEFLFGLLQRLYRARLGTVVRLSFSFCSLPSSII